MYNKQFIAVHKLSAAFGICDNYTSVPGRFLIFAICSALPNMLQ